MSKAGFIAIVGRPNVGKSTLLNKIIGQKIAIVSSKAQTTRHQIRGVLNEGDAQIVFVDTPGIHKPLHLLGEQLVKTALDTLTDVDLVLFVVDGLTSAGKGDKYIVELLEKISKPVVLVLNKLDSGKADPEILESYLHLRSFAAHHVVSALYGKGVVKLVRDLASRMPVGPAFYGEDELTDQTERSLAGELIREAVLRLTSQEVPHAVAVRVDEFKERENDQAFIQATLFVERDTQKGILIGEGGQMLKSIGTQARISIEKSLGRKVYLELWVKVLPNWRKQASSLKRLGYILE